MSIETAAFLFTLLIIFGSLLFGVYAALIYDKLERGEGDFDFSFLDHLKDKNKD